MGGIPMLSPSLLPQEKGAAKKRSADKETYIGPRLQARRTSHL